MRTPRLLRIALAAAGTLLVAGAAVAITASAAGLRLGPTAATSTPPSPAPASGKAAAACQDYLGHLAGQLNVSSSKLDAATLAAARATVEDQVKAGTLTRAQADKIEAKLPASGVCSALGAGLAGHHRAGLLAAARGAYLAAAASALGVTADQLKQDLKGGQTLSQVASAQGVSEDQFKTRVAAALKPKLDAAVAAGKLTQAQEDALLGKLQSGDPPLWSAPKAG